MTPNNETTAEDLGSTARILIVEDHTSFREALAFLFEAEPDFEVVAEAGSIAEAREAIREPRGLDVIVLDLALPDGDGVGFIRELATGEPGAAILVLSASVDNARLAWAVEAGAAGVLHKSAAVSQILDSARRLKAGEVLLSQAEVIEMLRIASRERWQEQEARRAAERLTDREREVLRALGEGLDGKEIARKLRITQETERTHMVNILNKLGAHSRLQALIFAARYGIVKIG